MGEPSYDFGSQDKRVAKMIKRNIRLCKMKFSLTTLLLESKCVFILLKFNRRERKEFAE